MRYDCFLSYASADVEIAEALYSDLTNAGFSVWFDRARLKPGFDWHQEIEVACEASRIILPVLTPRWKQSEWTKYETYGAEAIIPLVAEGLFEDVATPPLRRVQAAALTLIDGGTKRTDLADAIRVRLRSPTLDATERGHRLAHLRYRPTEHFVGRERDIEHLHEQLHVPPSPALTQGRVVAVVALGGAGKTTLARMYAEKFWRAYERLLWVDARLGYESEFARLLGVLRPDLATSLRDASLAQRAARAQQELERLESSRQLMTAALLIIDNAEDEPTVSTWIPRTGNVHTIITSRYAHWAAVSVHVLDVLQPAPASELLRQRSAMPGRASLTVEENAACDMLAAKLGFLPLALEQAAAYIGAQGIGFGFSDYLRLYGDNERVLLSMPSRGTTEYPYAVFVTWRATVLKLPKGARAMLRLAAFMAPTEIPLVLFETSADQISVLAQAFVDAPPDGVAEDASAELRVRSWRGALADYSMASASSADTLTVHGLVQAVERGQLAREEGPKWVRAAIDSFVSYAPTNAHLFENWRAWRRLLPHAQALIAQVQLSGVELASTALIRGVSLFLYAQGRYAEALPLARLVLSQDERVLGPEHPDTLTSVTHVAYLLQSLGAYADAEPLFRRALQSGERVLGPEHPDTLASVSSLAGLLERQGASADAELLFRRALEGNERVLGPEHPATLQSMHNLASVLESQGAYADAEPLARRALEGNERVLGPEHPDTLKSVTALAHLLRRQGDSVGAEPLLRRALAGNERVLGPEHPDTLISVDNLASLLQSQGAYAEADALFRRALNARERVLGPDHPDTLTGLNNLAGLLHTRGAYAQAEALLRRVLEARERVLGPEHPATLGSVNNLAGVLESQGAYAEAEALFRRSLEGLERTLGPEHPNTLTTLSNLAGLLKNQGTYAETEVLLRRALEGCARVLGPGDRATLASVIMLADVLQCQEATANAEALLRSALEGYERALGPEHPYTLTIVDKLVRLLQSRQGH